MTGLSNKVVFKPEYAPLHTNTPNGVPTPLAMKRLGPLYIKLALVATSRKSKADHGGIPLMEKLITSAQSKGYRCKSINGHYRP